ncbi:hypothetical protein D3C71_1656030 [compost metagenome]
MAHQAAARRNLMRHPGALDGIGVGDGDVGMVQRKLPHLRAALLGLVQPQRQCFYGGGVH